MKTVEENVTRWAHSIREQLAELLLKHSQIYKWAPPHVISFSGSYAFRELAEEGRQLQSKVIKDYNDYHALLSCLFQDVPKDTAAQLKVADKCLRRMIEQQETGYTSTQEALSEVDKALETQVGTLKHLFDPTTGEVLVVPDTNALLFNPDVEKWTFQEFSQFCLVLIPPVVAELDGLKVNHRNEEVRKKSESLIKRIKEYRRRGSLTEGVVVVKGKISLQAMAREADMNRSLPWLDRENVDDRLIATCLEIMRARPHSTVLLVTRDLNAQNKAEIAGLPFLEPPQS